MLLIRGKNAWKTHEKSGAAFELRAIGAEEYDRIRAEHTREGKLDYIPWCVSFATAAIANWRGVGDATGALPCSAENIGAFARTHAAHIMPWITSEATDFGRFLDEDIAAAKKD